MKLYLGIDGGQSHTTALLADESGHILGRGHAGPSNHTREPGGRERLISAVTGSIAEAATAAGLPADQLNFAAAHLALTGEPEEKIEIVNQIFSANYPTDHLVVGHDAPAALAGALSGEDGAIVLAGTGSVACAQLTSFDGPDARREYIRVGGHGYLFSDEGSGFSIAREALRRALRLEDSGATDDLQPLLLGFFGRQTLKAIAQDCYAGVISRDQLASFTATVGRLAAESPGTAREIIDQAASDLAGLAVIAIRRLGLEDSRVSISHAGGVFRNSLLMHIFIERVAERLPRARVIPPRFGPEIGALLLACLDAGRRLTPTLIDNISQSEKRQ